ncbi:hypothetical protein MKW06_001764 [Escherichia coli]|nr:hypothetical protein [Escherichia coli]
MSETINGVSILSAEIKRALVADIQFYETYTSAAFNRKMRGIVKAGFYAGFEPVLSGGLKITITSTNEAGKRGVASVDVGEYQITVQQLEDVIFTLPAGATTRVILEANYQNGVKTNQVDSNSGIQAARLFLADVSVALAGNQLEVCRLTVPAGTTTLSRTMLSKDARPDKSIGVELGNDVEGSSSEGDAYKAATIAAVKRAMAISVLTRGSIPDGDNLNKYGPSADRIGQWTKTTTTGATLANGYPEEDAVGILEVFRGGAWSGTQRFTSRNGNIYVRSLTATWNGTDGPWSAWMATHEAAPLPDVWLPLTDSMTMMYGEGPYDRITIGDQYAELTTRSGSFNRSTTASYIDKRGVMQIAAINEPRFEKPGLLMECGATNLFLNSESYRGSTGSKATNNSAKSPRGDMTMCLFQETAINGEHYLDDRNIALTADVTYCFSTFVAAGAGDRSLYLRVATGTSGGVIFNPTKGDWEGGIVGTAITERGFDDLGNGIYRVWMVVKAATTQVSIARLQISKGHTATYDGDIEAGIYVWGTQFEETPFPTSYIKTEAAAVTRGSDAWGIPGANLGYVTLAQKFIRTIAINLTMKYSPPTNYTEVLRSRGARNDIMCRVHQVNKQTTLTAYRNSGGIALTVDSKVEGVFAHKTEGDTVTTYCSGKTNTQTSTPTSTTELPIELGSSTASGFAKFVYHVRHLRIWHRALTESQIKGLR